MSDPVLAANRWPTNAHLIADVAKLGYLREDWVTLDPTAGRGTWWKIFRPSTLVCHDKYVGDGVDFRILPEPCNTFDAVAFDPPYVAKGGRATSGIKEMDNRYGQDTAPATPELLQRLIDEGLVEMRRVLKPGGILLVKCQRYVSSGKLFPGTHNTYEMATTCLGFEYVDEFTHITKIRPQPLRTRKDGFPVEQQHARNNTSTLFVFRKKRGKS